MKAAQINQYGDASVVKVTDTDRPVIDKEQVLVEVAAASLNPFDTMVRQGYVQESSPLQLPATLGGDIAGTVVEVGATVDGLIVGEAVYGQANVVAGNSGAFAEYAATAADQVATAPAGITIDQAASLPLVGVSALQVLNHHLALQPNQKILITGGAGGIGHIAIQIAKHIGAHVAATAAGSDLDTLKSLGADEVFDYTVDDYTTSLHDFDAAFDTVGGDELTRIVKVLKDDGAAVSMVGQPAQDRSIRSIHQMTRVTTSDLDQLRQLVESGAVKPMVSQSFALDQIVAAFQARESGTVSGKIVINIKS